MIVLMVLFAGVSGLVTVADVTAQGSVSPQESRTADTFMLVADITTAGAPRVLDDYVIFTSEQREYVRYIAAAFEHEEFQRLHVFTVREREGQPDLFYLAYPVYPDQKVLRYRLIVDGVWITDPHAPAVRSDRRGVQLGEVALREPPPYQRTSPVFHPDGSATFYFAFNTRIAPTLETVDARMVSVSAFEEPRVSITGTFNGWDPYMHRLEGPGPDGFYSITLPVPAGPHYYYFMVDGQRILDPLNGLRGRDMQTGTQVSRTLVP